MQLRGQSEEKDFEMQHFRFKRLLMTTKEAATKKYVSFILAGTPGTDR